MTGRHVADSPVDTYRWIPKAEAPKHRAPTRAEITLAAEYKAAGIPLDILAVEPMRRSSFTHVNQGKTGL